MSIARILLPYKANEEMHKLSREAYDELRLAVPTLCLPEWPEDKPERPYWHKYGEEIYIDLLHEGPTLTQAGISFEVKNFKSNYKAAGKSPEGDNITLSLHLPNIGLLSMDEVTWLDDACTQNIQTHLDEGWRIIAVCPPNGTRRPDYILGRTKPSSR